MMFCVCLWVMLWSLVAPSSRVHASIHTIHRPVTGCKFTERMFADGHGPWGLHGRSTVTVNATIQPLPTHQVTDTISISRLREYFDFGIVLVTFSDVPQHSGIKEHTVCARNFSDPIEGNQNGLLYGEFHRVDEADTVHVKTILYPSTSGLQTVLFVTCWKQKSEAFGYPVSATEFSMYPMEDPVVDVDATVAFQNPYGYLPALLYGLHPFTGCLSLLYGVVDVYFIVLLLQHRSTARRLQCMLMIVLLFATCETLSWFVTYQSLNRTGETVCCPYPPMFVVATTMKIMAGMSARIVTTLICLGYGVVRSHITWHELMLVTSLGICYFLSVGALESSHILNQFNGTSQPPFGWEVLVLATNACFGVWIFIALSLTRKNLAQCGQTEKLKMYDRLKQVLCGYALASIILLGLEGAVYSGTLALKWTWIWMIWASHRVVLFSILVVIAVIWRPQPTSWLYAQMEQVPTITTPRKEEIEMTNLRHMASASGNTPKAREGVNESSSEGG